MNIYAKYRIIEDIKKLIHLTETKCECGEEMYVDESSLLLSDPPKRRMFCIKCNNIKYPFNGDYNKKDDPIDKVELIVKHYELDIK